MRRAPPLPRLLRALALVATSGLAMCGVKGPPRPPEALQTESSLDAGAIAADAGAPATPKASAADAGQRP